MSEKIWLAIAIAGGAYISYQYNLFGFRDWLNSLFGLAAVQAAPIRVAAAPRIEGTLGEQYLDGDIVRNGQVVYKSGY